MSARRRVFTVSVAALAWIGLLPGIARAQGGTAAGAVAGVVRDTTGAVLPGVTVEAASPALIEKVRSGVTNEQGQFQIVNLSPGEYTVTFTLTGFRTVKREGITLSAGFTATVNGELSVGGLEETLTVTGETPLVDVHATNQKATFTREKMDDMPVTKNYASMAMAIIPGVLATGNVAGGANQDVGGTMGERNMVLTFHGSASTDTPQNLDGMRAGRGSGPATMWVINNGIVQETTMDTSGFSAESQNSGLGVNYITKAGGNKFSGFFSGAFTNNTLQASNLDDTLRAHGLTDPYKISRIWDFNPGFGGPIKRDKVWFYYSYRNWGTNDKQPGSYFQQNPLSFVYQPNLNSPAYSSTWVDANNLRLTWQASPNHKFGLYADNVARCICLRGSGSTMAPEATMMVNTPDNYYAQFTWNWTVSNRLLVEAAQTYRREIYSYYQYADLPPALQGNYPNAVGALDGISVNDSGLGVTYRGLGPQVTDNASHLSPGKASVSYVTGSHNLKVGVQWNPHQTFTQIANNIWSNTGTQFSYSFVSGKPSSVTLVAPGLTGNNAEAYGLFAQDQWTVHRLTLNVGLRFDYEHEYIPAHIFPATNYVGLRSFPEIDNIPNWKDVEPRFGASYDLFGNGKTALKWSAGRFVEALSLGNGNLANLVDPGFSTAATRTTRAWTDANGDFIAQPSELGPSSNANFGTSNVGITYDPATVNGWDKRAWNWEWSTGIQQELVQGLSLNVGYYHRARGAFRVTQNQYPGLTAASYSPYCVTAPVDARLPGGGGYSVCGLYDVNPAFFGKNTNVITSADNFGGVIEHYDSVDINVSARLPRHVTFQAGTNTGRIRDNVCTLAANPTLSALSTNSYGGGNVIPNDPAYCDSKPPFLTQFKMLVVYPLPWWGLQASATYQSIPGPPSTATWSAPVTAVTGLGRAISSGARTVSVPLVPYGTLYAARLNQVDVRFSKNFTVQRVKVQGQFNLYNVLNGNATTQWNNTFSPSNNVWQTPSVILGPRLAKFGIMVAF